MDIASGPFYNRAVSRPFATTINAATRLCAVVGHPVRHSASPAMHNAAFAALGMDWRYFAFDVRPERLREALSGAASMNFIGLNLTVPHKLMALEMVDAVDDSAKMWGAVNTIRFEGQDSAGAWRPLREFEDGAPEKIRSHGFNTDADAITRSLHEDLGVQIAGAKVLLMGAGGAGRTAALKLAAENVGELHLVNRTAARAEALRASIRELYPAVPVSIGYPKGAVDLALNATSLGLQPSDEAPWDAREFSLSRVAAVYDMVYRPAETALLKSARAAGCRVANGLGMLLHQGAAALELWTGRTAPIDVMREALQRNVYG
ncbi:MAG: shikimate dehydrogenase [Verrucomicrobiota bacterium]